MLETPQTIRSYSFSNVQHKVALLIILGGRDPVKEAPRFLQFVSIKGLCLEDTGKESLDLPLATC